ncbi:MAG: hypothetical protein ABEJ43_09350 [Haloferacaceae archaeon]
MRVPVTDAASLVGRRLVALVRNAAGHDAPAGAAVLEGGLFEPESFAAAPHLVRSAGAGARLVGVLEVPGPSGPSGRGDSRTGVAA